MYVCLCLLNLKIQSIYPVDCLVVNNRPDKFCSRKELKKNVHNSLLENISRIVDGTRKPRGNPINHKQFDLQQDQLFLRIRHVLIQFGDQVKNSVIYPWRVLDYRGLRESLEKKTKLQQTLEYYIPNATIFRLDDTAYWSRIRPPRYKDKETERLRELDLFDANHPVERQTYYVLVRLVPADQEASERYFEIRISKYTQESTPSVRLGNHAG
jgi:hypothetical protein